VFGWRAAKDNLATKRNKFRRTLEIDSVCPVCGNGTETSFHALVECTKARALRVEMRKYWDLPEEKAFRYTGPDWLQIMLSNIQLNRRGLVLLVLWRAWHLRCDVVHNKGESTIAGSVTFLKNYLICLKGESVLQDTCSSKGKDPCIRNDSQITWMLPTANEQCKQNI
jgi:hypothetical protein